MTKTVDGKKWQVWSVTDKEILMQRMILDCLWSQGSAWHRNSSSVLIPRPRVKTTDGNSCGTQVLPACAAFSGGLSGKEEWLVRVYCVHHGSLQIGVLYSSSWLPIVRAGESESILTLCLKHLAVFSLPPRTVIWTFNWILPGSFGRNYEVDRILLVTVFPWGKLFSLWCLSSFICKVEERSLMIQFDFYVSTACT